MRQRASDLLAVASRFGRSRFCSNYRECLQDVFDLTTPARQKQRPGGRFSRKWAANIAERPAP